MSQWIRKTFDSAGLRSFDKEFPINVTIFRIINSSSSHSENHKNNFLILRDDPTYGRRFNINFTKSNTKFCLSLHYNTDNGYLFVNGKEIFKSFKSKSKC